MADPFDFADRDDRSPYDSLDDAADDGLDDSADVASAAGFAAEALRSEPPFADEDRVSADAAHGLLDERAVDERSDAFVGRWNRLVSRTNWQKGKIIFAWRQALRESDAPAAAYSDDAWSRRVGQVTPQHVGRLRRVWERFGATHDEFAGLYWSHFLAAVEWTDAEMWLEGARTNGWSVSQMREQRWEAIGAPEALKPREEDIIVAEVDEDAPATIDAATTEVIDPENADDRSRAAEAPPFSDEVSSDASDGSFEAENSLIEDAPKSLAALGSLPSDLYEAFDALKLAILGHKTNGWREARVEDVLDALDALRRIAVAPGD